MKKLKRFKSRACHELAVSKGIHTLRNFVLGWVLSCVSDQKEGFKRPLFVVRHRQLWIPFHILVHFLRICCCCCFFFTRVVYSTCVMAIILCTVFAILFRAFLMAGLSSLRTSPQFHYSYSFFFFFAPPSLLSGVLLHYMSTLLLPPSRFVARLMTRRHGDTIFDSADIFVCWHSPKHDNDWCRYYRLLWSTHIRQTCHNYWESAW